MYTSGISPYNGVQLHISDRTPFHEEGESKDSSEEKIPSPNLNSLEVIKYQSFHIEEENGLWQMLYKQTQILHVTARKIPFLVELVNPKQTMTCSMAYVIYLCNLFAIHKSLEEAQVKIIEKYGDGHCVFPILYRSDKLLKDIQIWSIFNLPEIFADLNASSNEFSNRVLAQIDSHTKAYLAQLNKSVEENPLYAIGALYTFYGTILSGGQFVKDGVLRAFLLRVIGKREAWVEESKLWVTITQKWNELLKEGASYFNKGNGTAEEIIQCFQERLKNFNTQDVKWLHLKEKWQAYLQETINLFTFPKKFLLSEFKQQWHQSLNELPGKIKFTSTEESQKFSERLAEEANRAMQAVIDFIPSMQEHLIKKKLPIHPN